jgi:hypothetical protein
MSAESIRLRVEVEGDRRTMFRVIYRERARTGGLVALNVWGAVDAKISQVDFSHAHGKPQTRLG